MNSVWPRALDHCVLPTTSLDIAAARLGALGFQLAPIGVHPFGTSNRCVYFADESFLEMLVTSEVAAAEAAADAGNVFVQRQLDHGGGEGFTALVLRTDDAIRDHQAFVEAGVSAGEILEFSRPVRDASGNEATASFRLAFASTPEAPDILVFTCQRVAVPKVDRSGLQSHPNGVRSIRSVTVAGGLADALEPVRAALQAGQGTSVVSTVPIDPWDFQSQVFSETPRLAAIRFGVEDLARVGMSLAATGIDFIAEPSAIAVPPAPGQGATFIFEAIP